MTTWVNSDGLEVKFGTEQYDPSQGGALGNVGGDGELMEVIVRGDEVPTADAPINIDIQIPDGAFLDTATLYVTEAFLSAGAATLDLGIFSDDGDGTYTVVDADGIDAAVAKATLVADAKIVCDGALIGTTLDTNTRNLVLSYGFGTAAFTSGEARLVVKYRYQ